VLLKGLISYKEQKRSGGHTDCEAEVTVASPGDCDIQKEKEKAVSNS